MSESGMENKISVDNLIIEVTRRCNMACEHCLRGDAQNKDISKETVDALLDQIDEVTNLTFTGGEPMLNTDGMKYIMSEIVRRKIPVCHVWFATNGTIYDDSFMRDYRNFIHYCQDWEEIVYARNRGSLDYEGGGWLSVSTDQYHDLVDEEILNLYRDFVFYGSDKEGTIDYDATINEGRAKENGLGSRQLLHCIDLEVSVIKQGVYYASGLLYVSSLGEVLASCNASYETQKELSFGNVSRKTLIDMFVEQKLVGKTDVA